MLLSNPPDKSNELSRYLLVTSLNWVLNRLSVVDNDKIYLKIQYTLHKNLTMVLDSYFIPMFAYVLAIILSLHLLCDTALISL